MMPFLGSVLGVMIVFGGLWWFEFRDLQRRHSRKGTFVLDGLRYVGIAAIVLLAVWVIPRSTVKLVLAVLALALFLVPEKLLLRIGGIEPKWELRALQDEAGRLTGRYLPLKPPERMASPEFVQGMEGVIERMLALKAPEVAPLRDLLVVDFRYSMTGLFHPAYEGLRSIRLYQLERELFGSQARRPDLEPAEATFRWRLFRTLGDMIDCGSPARDPDDLAKLRELTDELEVFRRSDTAELIEALQESARRWIEDGASVSWPPEASLAALGPPVERGYLCLWSRRAVFWGAELDERDLLALPAIERGEPSAEAQP